MVELTVPYESRMEEAHAFKEGKYLDLIKELKKDEYEAKVMPVRDWRQRISSETRLGAEAGRSRLLAWADENRLSEEEGENRLVAEANETRLGAETGETTLVA
ncbi:hypothetical protein PoB_003883900 [Plakobranchus ocellatus]|uniref:Uncharacterized protein n=1 Tax=Plakobranchus ocellatus TaxID=259542 RepID=A0AAV4AX05_9GAST|nr:hypothetical protein PoB_003883900 [Plakobranchus ocellatus]